MTQVPERIAQSPASWLTGDVVDDASWCEPLADDAREQLERIVASVGEVSPEAMSAALLPRTGALVEATARWRAKLSDGRGFVLVRGLDATASAEALARRFVVLGLYLGVPVPQNLRGELLTHVRDTGADPSLPSTRLYTTRAEQDFHTDGADIIGLTCRRTARRGGESRIASSSRIVSEIQRTRPDLYPVLFEDFPWHYQEEGLGPFVLTRPIVSVAAQTPAGARLNTFFIPWYIRRSQELPDAPRLSAAQDEAIALIEALANDPRFHLDMTFEPGDVQWLKNASILHKRTAYEDHDALEDKRHLLRLWLRADDFVDGDAQLRGGITEGLTR